MTRQRNDSHSTEFGLWLRRQEEIDSKLGYTATNLDYVWRNWKTGDFILIEEKRYNSSLTYSQAQTFQALLGSMKEGNFVGFFLIVFEKTDPDDGAIFINKKPATRSELMSLLKFDKATIAKFSI